MRYTYVYTHVIEEEIFEFKRRSNAMIRNFMKSGTVIQKLMGGERIYHGGLIGLLPFFKIREVG
jgi:hypothetical protein